MTHRLATNYAKNYSNRTPIIVKVIVENVVTCFLGTQCSYCGYQKYPPMNISISPFSLPSSTFRSVKCNLCSSIAATIKFLKFVLYDLLCSILVASTRDTKFKVAS